VQQSICVLISQAPYGTVHAAEAVRHVNGALSQGFSAVALLVDDGVWLARSGQDAAQSGFTSLSQALADSLQKARVVVHGPSLAERGLTPADLLPGVTLATDAELADIMTDAQFLLRF